MYLSKSTFLLGGWLAGFSSSRDIEASVHENVGAEDFSELLKANYAVLTSFQTSAECSSCSLLLPELQRVVNGISEVKALNEIPVTVATIDCDADGSRALCTSYDVHSYPAIRLVYGESAERKGWVRFREMRKGYALTSFISRHVLDPISRPQTQEALDDLLLADSSVVVLQTGSSESDDLAQSIATQTSGKITFGVVDKPELIIAQKASPSLLCYRNGEDYTYTTPHLLTKPVKVLTREDVRSKANVDTFIEHCAAAQVHEFGRRKMNKLYALRKPIVYIFTDAPLSIGEFLNPLQKAWAEVVPFVHVDVNEHPHLATSLGLSAGQDFPAVSVEGVINDQVYPMPASWEVEPGNVEAFVGGILHGKAVGGRDGMGWVENAGLKPRLKTVPKDEL